tara:strand:+ start:2032 stop:2586 length:555 start_codon:yes stop_codon:yes gene_type:complete
MSQSLDLENAANVTFNGSPVDRINLNGTQIWYSGIPFTTTNYHEQVRDDKLQHDHDSWGFTAMHPALSLVDHYNNLRGYISPENYDGFRIGSCYTTTGTNTICTTGGFTIEFYGTIEPLFTSITVEGQKFMKSDAGYFHHWGQSQRSYIKAAAGTSSEIWATGYHWHGQGTGLFRGATSTVVIR